MNPVRILGEALRTAWRAIRTMAGAQNRTRSEIVGQLQAVCDRCDTAYATVLERLLPVKQSLGKLGDLASELRAFAADGQTRSAFKPQHLCGEVDQLLQRLASKLDMTVYSIDVQQIGGLRECLRMMGNYDGALWDYYDQHTREMDKLALAIEQGPADKAKEAIRLATHLIDGLQEDVSQTLDRIRSLKDEIRDSM